ncbi:nucleotidyl transferase AbiEii/AbiGii toxin family protein [candidate division WOR-3 bacterium]|nr:nucleotidyl transferase AbiEii/AbiGii toxin family protein [candidate division WOR-3 bacterium]
MIPEREIREKARENGVPETTIERDYAQNCLLNYFSNIPMVLKGGTGIRKTYIENYRFSDDLDFTLLEKLDKDMLEESLNKAVRETREESGINFNDGIHIEENINGFEIPIYFSILRRGGTPLKIKLDLTNPEKERILLPIERKGVLHPYSDRCLFKANVYSLEEIMAEKIRSLFERTRPRDLYDVSYLQNKIKRERMTDILSEKCRFKSVEIEVSSLENRKFDFSNAWKNSLGNQLKDLPDFNYVYNKVIEQVGKYETNRNS